jgi:cytochrome c-type biogenesis protein
MIDLLSDVGTSFVLGLLTPLTAVCVIPLYPAFLARLSRQVSREGDRADKRLLAFFGVVVTLGVIAFMASVGLIFTTLLQESLTAVIGVISPIAFAIMAGLGVALMLDLKPQRKVRPNRISNPYVSAFLYGYFFGAIVVPCNPLFIAAFFARVASVGSFAEGMAQFFAFGLGIGAPLMAFSLISRAASRTMVNALVAYNRQIDLVAGAVMVVVAVYYLFWVFHVHESLAGLFA